MRKSVANIPLFGNILKGKSILKEFSKIQRLMKLTQDEIKTHQLIQLKKTVKYAYENVEMYRKKWDLAGISPEDIHTLKDIEKFPITTKDDLRKYYPKGILSKKIRAKDCFILGTSGSTGSPIKVFFDYNKIFFEAALLLGGIGTTNYKDAIKKKYSLIDLVRESTKFKNLNIVVLDREAIENLGPKIHKKLESYYVDSLISPAIHVNIINRVKPYSLFSYPSCLRNISNYVLENKIHIHQPEYVSMGGENLETFTRQKIKQVFNKCKLINAYGTTEIGAVASECINNEGLHIRSWKVLLELVDNNAKSVPDGVHGKILITDLYARATPIIRYSGLGDSAVIKKTKCSCGRKTPLLENIDGRIVDIIKCPDGRIVHPYSLTLQMQDIPYLSKFQIRQEKENHIRVLLVKSKVNEANKISYVESSKIGKMILKRFNDILGDQIKVELVQIDDIPKRVGSHKFATVLSLIKEHHNEKQEQLVEEKIIASR